ncbi:MAG: hypothetical protein HOJ61_01605 [Gammaproteobacteria bacterium]|jgi:cytochrome b|nr:hypothetical protein [Gammaproteobacteria bacterium]MBT5600905.1 hypothetical protein [Gammaproteobacteria bacterium]MBT6247105.1 hypothetical protein [Gammaproteobacteria bacterium]
MQTESHQNQPQQETGEIGETKPAIPQEVRIWDIPTRLFHWSLISLVVVSCYTGLTGGFYEMDWHMKSGYGILTLVLFRILWGIIGTHYAQFREFLPGPSQIKRHLTTALKKPYQRAGHNPLGALNIFVILITLLVQTITGLFANDDIFTEGPLAGKVSYETSRWLTGIHEINIWVLAGLVTMHLLAIALHQFHFRDNLVKAMLTGKKKAKAIQVPLTLFREIILGAVTFACSALVVYLVITY